jgi:hypothetical protein
MLEKEIEKWRVSMSHSFIIIDGIFFEKMLLLRSSVGRWDSGRRTYNNVVWVWWKIVAPRRFCVVERAKRMCGGQKSSLLFCLSVAVAVEKKSRRRLYLVFLPFPFFLFDPSGFGRITPKTHTPARLRLTNLHTHYIYSLIIGEDSQSVSWVCVCVCCCWLAWLGIYLSRGNKRKQSEKWGF